MKKAVLCIAMTVMAVVAQAQYSDLYYHRSGDTIVNDWPTYYHSWWDLEICRQEGHHVDYLTSHVTALGDMFCVEKYYTPVPLKVVGIAASFNIGHMENYIYYEDSVPPSPEYFMLYDADSSGIHEIARAEWSDKSSERILMLEGNGTYHAGPLDSCCYDSPWTRWLPIYERYFDTAVWVMDSFYVGHTGFMHGRDNYLMHKHALLFTIGFYSCDCKDCPLFNECADYVMRFPQIRMIFPDSIYQRIEDWNVPITFPIIQVDTTVPLKEVCPPISNVEVLPDVNSAIVSWDGYPYYTRVELRYGNGHFPISTWNIVEVTGNTVTTLTDLEPSMYYGIQFRAYCDSCKKTTPWTTTANFFTYVDTANQDTTGITAPSLLAAQTFLQPNPASDKVTVSSGFSLQRIELHDAAGVLVYSEPAWGHQATVSLDFLRAGTYIVTIQTHYGTTHKKLIVKR